MIDIFRLILVDFILFLAFKACPKESKEKLLLAAFLIDYYSKTLEENKNVNK